MIIERLPQSDVWTGSTTSSNTTSGTVSDSIANVGASTFWEKLVSVITTPFEWLADTVLTGIKSIFVPSEDYLTDKAEYFGSRFPFIPPVVDAVKDISLALSNPSGEPPVIYVDLSASRGSYELGGEVPFIDLRWYAEYKSIVDKLLSAFLWIVFIWRLFRQIPGILSGMPGEFFQGPLVWLPGQKDIPIDYRLENSHAIVPVSERFDKSSKE